MPAKKYPQDKHTARMAGARNAIQMSKEDTPIADYVNKKASNRRKLALAAQGVKATLEVTRKRNQEKAQNTDSNN